MKENIGVCETHVGDPVKSLVLQLGVPVESVPRCTKALYVAFGSGDQSTQRIVDFLTSKISGKKT